MTVLTAQDPHSAAALWASLSEVEKTCLQVAFVRWDESHRTWPDGKPWYKDPYGGLWVDACIPEDQQKQMRQWKADGDRIADVMAVRTAEIDSRIRDAVYLRGSSAASPVGGSGEKQLIGQLVIVGAGADMRAWRLDWPPGFKLFEVDSETVLGFKRRVLAAAGPVFVDSLSVDRIEVVADASQPQDMVSKLVTAGLDLDRPVFYLLEGLLGYLALDRGNDLLSTLQHSSAPGSRILVTVPPGPAVKAAKEKAQADAAAAAAHSNNKDTDSKEADTTGSAARVVVVPVVHMGEGAAGGVSTVQANMPHVTFEDPQDTHARVVAAGWAHHELLGYDWLAHKYGVAHAQPIVLARKA